MSSVLLDKNIDHSIMAHVKVNDSRRNVNRNLEDSNQQSVMTL